MNSISGSLKLSISIKFHTLIEKHLVEYHKAKITRSETSCLASTGLLQTTKVTDEYILSFL